MEIAVTVPYEIKIDAEGINLDTFECFFVIFSDTVSYGVELVKKEEFYILKVPKELSFLNGKPLKYEVQVKKENAIFPASTGELTILGIVPDQFKVEIKAHNVDAKVKQDVEVKGEGDKAVKKKVEATEEPVAKENSSEKKKVKEDVDPLKDHTPEKLSRTNKSRVVDSIDEPTKYTFFKNILESRQQEPDNLNTKVKNILKDFKT